MIQAGGGNTEFFSYWASQISYMPFIVQEYIEGNSVEREGMFYDPTIRIMLLASFENDEVTIQYKNAFYDFPVNAIKSGKFDYESRVSAAREGYTAPHLAMCTIEQEALEHLFSELNLRHFKNLMCCMKQANPREFWIQSFKTLSPQELKFTPSLVFMMQQIERANSQKFVTDELEQLKAIVLMNEVNLLTGVVLILKYHYFAVGTEGIDVYKQTEQLHVFALQLAKKSCTWAIEILKLGLQALLAHYNSGHKKFSESELQKMHYVVKFSYYHFTKDRSNLARESLIFLKELEDKLLPYLKAKFNFSLELSDNKSGLFFKNIPSNVGKGPWAHIPHLRDDNLPLDDSPRVVQPK